MLTSTKNIQQQKKCLLDNRTGIRYLNPGNQLMPFISGVIPEIRDATEI